MKDRLTRLNAMKLYAVEMLLAAAHHVDPPPSNPRRIPCHFRQLDLREVFSITPIGASSKEDAVPELAYSFSLVGSFRGYDETISGEGSVQALAGIMIGRCVIRAPLQDGVYVWHFRSVLRNEEVLLISVDRHSSAQPTSAP